MTLGKQEILSEIKRTAADNGGVPLGIRTFARQTGIRHADWFGIHWRSWGDAVREAGFRANTLTQRPEDDELVRRYAELTRELARVPTKGDLRLVKRRDSTFPSESALTRRFGSYYALRIRAHQYCTQQSDFADVLPLLAVSRSPRQPDHSTAGAASAIGYVYLVKHGSRADFKIGRTMNPVRREGEIRLQLPEKLQPVHYIATDDPAGVEAYWHTRFGKKRKEGEWFGLSADDVRAFEKWKRIS